MLRRNSASAAGRAAEPEVVEPPDDVVSGKGRPTPKRRDTTPQRGPVQAPKNRKEAYRWQKQQTKGRRPAAGGKAMSNQAFREALRRGDPAALPKRDRGPVRALARDWVDSHRMLSNYMLALFPLMVVGFFIPLLNIAVIGLLFTVLVEWYLTGRRVRALALSRLDTVREGPWSIGFYAGSRAYMPRKWRMPGPRVQVGDQI
jgi:hypothetical protein